MVQREHYEVEHGKTLCWGKQLRREGPGGPGGRQGDREPATSDGSRGDRHRPGLREQERSQPSSLCSFCSALDDQPRCPWAGLPYPSTLRVYTTLGNSRSVSSGGVSARAGMLLNSSR